MIALRPSQNTIRHLHRTHVATLRQDRLNRDGFLDEITRDIIRKRDFECALQKYGYNPKKDTAEPPEHFP